MLVIRSSQRADAGKVPRCHEAAAGRCICLAPWLRTRCSARLACGMAAGQRSAASVEVGAVRNPEVTILNGRRFFFACLFSKLTVHGDAHGFVMLLGASLWQHLAVLVQ